jgi:hypothetical protein
MPHTKHIYYPKIGELVKSNRHGYVGIVKKIRFLTDKEWFDAQEIPVTNDERLEPFVLIAVVDGGGVDVPMSSLQLL